MVDVMPPRRKVVVFLETYLPISHTFIYEQMNGLPNCDVRFAACYRVLQEQYPTDNVTFLNEDDYAPPSALGWKMARLRQRLTGRYAELTARETTVLRSLLERERPDVVHAHWGPDAMRVAPLCRELKLPLVAQFHGFDVSRLLDDPVYVRALPALFRDMDLGISVSETMREKLIKLGCPPERVVAHYIGVNQEYFEEYPWQPDPNEFVVLQVGRLMEKKGHRYAVEALALVAGDLPRARLHFIGDGPLETELREQVAKLKLESRVEFLGRRSHAEVLRQMRACDAVLAPSVTAGDGDMEGLPVVVMEGLACGKPVVSTRHAGIPEVVCYSEPDWLVEERDVTGLAERLRRLATDPPLCARLGGEGKQVALEKLHLPTQNARLAALYDRAIAHARGR